jgi:predicted extracellular nuclease/2',3'-cyclic-nucleotide 2'-phosphodiesterase (5'-nucleotidase family)
MPGPRSRRRARLAALVTVALAITGFQFLVAPAAQAVSTGLVISEAYGGGGNAGSTYKNDFIELYNYSASPVSVSGMSVQYRSSNGSGAAQTTNLTGSVPAHGYYLIQEAAGTGGTTNLPTPDATGSIAMGGSAFTVYLATTTTALTLPTGNITNNGQVLDLVGSNSNTFEGTTGAAVSNTTSISRNVANPDTDVNSVDFTVGAPTPQNAGPAPLALANPGTQNSVKGTAISTLTLNASGGSGAYTFAATGLPSGLALNTTNGQITGTPDTVGDYTVHATADDGTSTVSQDFDWHVTDTVTITPIATIQGNSDRSPFAGSGSSQGTDVLTTEGVITALYTKGFTNGAPGTGGVANCGFCGFYIQTEGSGGDPDLTPGQSDAVFVFAGSSFAGKDKDGTDLAIGQTVQVSGKVSEFGTPESLTELNAPAAQIAITGTGTVTKQATLPATYADREAHEGELFQPTDLVITDTFNFETFGELGLAQDHTIVQPTENCLDTDTACITAAQADIKNRGWFVEDGTGVTFSSGANFYRPKNSANSDIPLPYIDKNHSARVGASVTYPKGGVLDFRNKKWYVQVPRTVLSTHDGAPDLGTDVLTIEDTRPQNLEPADVGGDLKIATYNVENFFDVTGEAFAAANPYYATSGPGCEWDYDRQDTPILTFQCTSPQGVPDAWDPVTHVPTHYHAGLVSAPRGAATQASLDRQTSKIVTAINGLGADVVSLEELGNVNKLRMGVTNGPLNPDPDKTDGGLGTPIAWRDESIAYLVDHLNDAAGAGTWGFVASPEESTDATTQLHMCATKNARGQDIVPVETAGNCSWASGQDVIRSGFLYKLATVVPVGQSSLDLPGLHGAPVPSPFDNAREPLAQYFKPVGHPNSDGFAVIVNHFKSKGDADSGDGGGPATGDNANDPLVGAFNGDRTRQAGELLRFANWFADKWSTDKVFLVGDFNSYTHEDPVQTILNDPDGIDDLNFGIVDSDDDSDTTYDFTTTVDGVGYGGTGSLDHVFASQAARDSITGADVWEINANEPGIYNYSRYNTNKTDFWDGSVPFAGSDHNPFLIGIDVAANDHPVRDIQIIGANDFHGRLLGDASDGGAAQLAGAVKSLKSTYGDGSSVFVSAGDNVGASIFESFTAQDKPTIDALNAAGLEFSSIGNHEFDKGWHDLVNRITNPADPHGGAGWKYLGANVVYDGDPDGAGPLHDGDPIVAPSAMKDFGGGIKVGFVGAVTEDLPGLVSPSGLEGVKVNPIVASVNNAATQLKTDGADLVIVLLHEGAASTDCSTMLGANNAYADILNNLDPSVDAVLSGHTHLEYSCSFPVEAWASDDTHPIKDRPVMQAGSYGLALDQLVYEFDDSGTPVSVVQNNVGVKGAVSTLFNYPEDPAVKQIVDDAVAASAVPGAQVLGKITGPFKRARLADGVTENRGGESTLGNQVAEIQRWAADTQIAFMNPGGLRADLLGTGSDYPKDVTYRQAADVQPFANELTTMQMTGAQIRDVLEQQWQRDVEGNVPSRPFLRLGASKGFTYTYDETADPDHAGATLGHVTGMWLNGVPVEDATTYSVTMNSFLASGGDNFRAFLEGTDVKDTGLTDLQAQVDYMAANAKPANPLAVDYGQHAVQVTFAAGAPASYAPGDTVEFDVASLAMTAVGDVQDDAIDVVLDGEVLGTFPVDNTMQAARPYDETGTASVSVELPADLADGSAELHLVGDHTGTDVIVAIPTDDGLPDTTVSANSLTVPTGSAAQVPVTVNKADAGGTIEVYDGATLLGSATVTNGAATVTIPANQLPAVGVHQLTLKYSGDPGKYSASTGTFTLTVDKATATITAPDVTVPVGQTGTATVTVTATGLSPTGTVTLKNGATVIDTKSLSGGQAQFSLPTLPDGTVLTVDYSGDANVKAASTTFTVHKGAKANATLSVADVTVEYGKAASVTVHVDAPVAPTGTVTVKNGATTLGTGTVSGGVATITLPAASLPAGSATLSATYSGDGNVNGATRTFTVTVTKAGSMTTAKVKPGHPKAGHKVKLKVSVAADNGVTATGKVTVKLDGHKVTGTLKNGKVTLKLGRLAKGVHHAKVVYAGDGNLAGSRTKVKIQVS